MKRIKQWLAARRLHRIVMERRNSFQVQDYTRRRAAALKGKRSA